MYTARIRHLKFSPDSLQTHTRSPFSTIAVQCWLLSPYQCHRLNEHTFFASFFRSVIHFSPPILYDYCIVVGGGDVMWCDAAPHQRIAQKNIQHYNEYMMRMLPHSTQPGELEQEIRNRLCSIRFHCRISIFISCCFSWNFYTKTDLM